MILIAGNRLVVPWGSDNDAHVYATLAKHLAAGEGYAFAGVPTALRPPLYSLVLASFVLLFGSHWVIAVRLFQAALSLITSWLCGKLAVKWFGPWAFLPALTLALFFPTLGYFVPEIMTECCAAFLAVCILYAERPALAGVLSGLLLLTRLNALPLAVAMALKHRQKAITYTLAVALTLLPWCVRNLIVFHGQALLSTNSGLSIVEGVLNPDGRAQTRSTKDMLGWESNDIESDTPQPGMRDEVRLDRQAKTLGVKLWSEQGIRALPLVVRKLGYFWLGTDQFTLGTMSRFPMHKKLIRWTGLAVYWALLSIAILGFRKLAPETRRWLIIYAVALTAFHLPVIMASRYRVPLFDPILAILGGAGLVAVWPWRRRDPKSAV